MAKKKNDPIFEMFLFETNELTAQLEDIALSSEKNKDIGDSINEIFRIMHTIKGSASMMEIMNISELAHSLENLFHLVREGRAVRWDNDTLCDFLLNSVDFFKAEITKLENGLPADGDPAGMVQNIDAYLERINPCEEKPAQPGSAGTATADGGQGALYRATIFFDEGCQMENIRAYEIIHRLERDCKIAGYSPADIMDNDKSIDEIRQRGFVVTFSTELPENEVKSKLEDTMFLRELLFEHAEQSGQSGAAKSAAACALPGREQEDRMPFAASHRQSMISVSTDKLDTLMDLVGELVIAEAMVMQNPELNGLNMESLRKDTARLEKITNELRDVVMAVRMVPLTVTFQKMNRIVRDMSIKQDKKILMSIVGEETEVDKSIIDQISDPLMHIIRNSIDHGIESAEERLRAGKPEHGTISLEARNSGGEVLITVRDDGRGLDREKILAKAREKGLLTRPENEMTDKEVFSLIFLPGFSTSEKVSEFSGRGVGMDVVNKNIKKLGGVVYADSVAGKGTDISIRIPLTLAIIDGMLIRVGESVYTIPIVNIRESFRTTSDKVFTDTEGNEMIMVRDSCYRVIRLYELFKTDTGCKEIESGIMVMTEGEHGAICLFADALLGQQQVVIKALPSFLKTIREVSGCTLLGDGSISLILDVNKIN